MKPNAETTPVVDVLDHISPTLVSSLRLIPGRHDNEGLITIEETLSDDFNNENDDSVLDFLEGYKVKKPGQRGTDPYIEYLARTSDPEIASERTTFFEKELEKVAKGTRMEGKVTVVILNKGVIPTAYIRDDVIFISQSMMNILGEVGFDSIIAVLDHELRHGINETVSKSQKAGSMRGKAVDWFHEGASDAVLKDLEKMGYRSDALSKGFSRLRRYLNDQNQGAGNRRDFEHQTLLARMSQDELLHDLIDTETSNQPFKKVPPEYQRNVVATNGEIIRGTTFTGKDSRIALACLSKMHPADLQEVYKNFNDGHVLRESLIPLLRQRLGSKFNEEEINIYLIHAFKSGVTFRDFDHVKELMSKAYLPTASKIDKEFFKFQTAIHSDDDIQRSVIKYFIHNKFAVEDGYDGWDISREQFLEFFEIVKANESKHLKKREEIEERYGEYNDTEDSTLPQQVIIAYAKYIQKLSLVKVEGNNLNEIRYLFQDLKAMRVISQKELALAYDWAIEEIEQDIFRQEGFYFDDQGELDDLQRERDLLKENHQIVLALINEVFPEKNQEKLVEKSKISKSAVDELFQSIEGKDLIDQDKFFRNFFNDLEFEKENILETDIRNFYRVNGQKLDERDLAELIEERRKEVLDYFLAKFGALNFDTSEYFYMSFEGYMTERSPGQTRNESELNRDEVLTRTKLNWDIKLAAINGFKPNQSWTFQYYQNVISEFEASGFDFESMRIDSLARFMKPIIDGSTHARFLELRPMTILQEKVNNYLNGIDSLRTLNTRLQSPDFSPIAQRLISNRGEGMYGDSLGVLVFGEIIRNRFENLIEDGIQLDDYQDLEQIVGHYYPQSPQRQAFLRKLSYRIYSAEEISIGKKLETLERQFSIESTLFLAEQINNLPDYLKLRDLLKTKYQNALNGDSSVEVLAYGDFMTSLLKENHYRTLVDSAEPQNANKASNDLAALWDNAYKRYFNQDRNLFDVPARERPAFVSLADSIEYLKNLTEEQRFAIVHKTMTEQRGFLSSPQERRGLYNRVIAALDIQDDFLKSVFEAVLINEEEDLTIVALIASKMLGPKLFQAYSVDEVSGTRNSYRKYVYESSTQRLIDFGRKYDNYGNERIYLLAQQSHDSFFRVTQRLNEVLLDNSPRNRTAEGSVSRATPIIEGAKGLGSPAVKGMQIAAIAYEGFSDDVRDELFETFDANKGMNKLKLWENIALKIEKDPIFREFFEQVEEIKEYLGGGSLFTTYRIKMKDGRSAVIKILNSNAEKFIADRYRLENSIVDQLSQSDDPKIRKQAEFTSMCAAIANNWCIREINDPTYEVDDENARKLVVARFNERKGRNILSVPKRIFTSTKVKVEEEFKGITLKAFLQRGDISEERKAQALALVNEFYDFQLENPVMINGEERYLVFSDPSVGNMMIDPDSAEINFGIIDRNFYIQLTKKQAETFRNFRDGNYIRFVNSFVDEILDANKTRGFADRLGIKYEAAQMLTKEFQSQKKAGKVSSFSYIQKVTDLFARKGLVIPLELSLMIINIDRMKKIQKRK